MKILSYDVGINNLAYCLIDTNKNGPNGETICNKILEWDIININDQVDILNDFNYEEKLEECVKSKTTIPKKLKKKKPDIETIALGLYHYLNSHNELSNVDLVLIENQPCMKNPTMKSIQMIIFSYYILKKSNNVNVNVKFISAQNKLKNYKEEDYGLDMSNIKSKYTKRKKLSIAVCGEMIKDDINMTELYKLSKKKDDLADSYLQAIYYINR